MWVLEAYSLSLSLSLGRVNATSTSANRTCQLIVCYLLKTHKGCGYQLCSRDWNVPQRQCTASSLCKLHCNQVSIMKAWLFWDWNVTKRQYAARSLCKWNCDRVSIVSDWYASLMARDWNVSFRECIALRHNWFSRQRCELDTLTDSISDKP